MKKLLQPLPIVAMTLVISMLSPVIAADTIIYLTRHAEKESAGTDPALTAQGQQRAQNIANTLKKVGIKTIYSTNYVRTQQTAQPLASVLILPVQSYDATQLATFAQQLKNARNTTLVVGHSDTTPELIRLLGGDPGADIGEAEFDRLYQVIIGDDGHVTTVLLTSLPSTLPNTCTTVSVNKTALAGALNSWTYFTIDVPECANTLNVSISGGTGDADMYVRFGAQPNTNDYACRPYKTGNTENCVLPNPQAGTWYIGLKAFKAFSGLNLTANATP